jgi:hypothetical protein
VEVGLVFVGDTAEVVGEDTVVVDMGDTGVVV